MNHALRTLGLAGLVVLCACASSITLKPVTPGATAAVAAQHGVSAVNVSIADDMPADRAKILNDLQVATKLQKALLASFEGNGQHKPDGVTLNATIHAFRLSNWGGNQLGVQVTVTDSAGNVVEEFERQSGSARGGSHATRTQRLAQDLLQKITDET